MKIHLTKELEDNEGTTYDATSGAFEVTLSPKSNELYISREDDISNPIAVIEVDFLKKCLRDGTARLVG